MSPDHIAEVLTVKIVIYNNFQKYALIAYYEGFKENMSIDTIGFLNCIFINYNV